MKTFAKAVAAPQPPKINWHTFRKAPEIDWGYISDILSANNTWGMGQHTPQVIAYIIIAEFGGVFTVPTRGQLPDGIHWNQVAQWVLDVYFSPDTAFCDRSLKTHYLALRHLVAGRSRQVGLFYLRDTYGPSIGLGAPRR